MLPALKPIWIAPALLAATAGVAVWHGGFDGLSHLNSAQIGEHMAAVKHAVPEPLSEGERLMVAAAGAGAGPGGAGSDIENGSAVMFSAVAQSHATPHATGHTPAKKIAGSAPSQVANKAPTKTSASAKAPAVKKINEDQKQIAYLQLMKKLPYEELTLPVADGFKLYARLYDPSQPIEADEEEGDEEDTATDDAEEDEDPPVYKYPLVVLLHGLNGSNQDWSAMPIRLVERGYAVLAVDLRGHGLKAKKGWRNFTPLDWQNMPKDMPMLMRDLVSLRAEDFPQMDTDRVAIIGAGMGANVAIHAADRPAHHVKALMLLSPSLQYKGMDQVRALNRYTNPVFFVASQNDMGPFEDTKILFRLAQGKRSLELYRALGHGTDMIRFYPELQAKMVDWLASYVPPQKILVPPELDEEDGDEE